MKQALIANITAILIFIQTSILCAGVGIYFIVSTFGIFNEGSKQQIILEYILACITIFVSSYIATKAGLFMINTNRKFCAKSISIILPISFLLIWNGVTNMIFNNEFIFNFVFIPALIFISSYLSGKIFIKNNGDKLIPE